MKSAVRTITTPYDPPAVLAPGRNCWRIEHADHAAFLIDGDAYFKALAAALRSAQRSILIVGWDFHSRMAFPGDGTADGQACLLGDFLNSLVKNRRGLHVHILIWDFPMIFGLDRDWSPLLNANLWGWGAGWTPAARVHFRYDNTHPTGGSHHQKIVVVDDRIAFTGGIDLTCRRWDTCAHSAEESGRIVDGAPYPPIHDVMMAVDGDAAIALGDLARERWRQATNKILRSPLQRRRWRESFVARAPLATKWPQNLTADVHDVDVAISRTAPPTDQSAGVREIEALYIDMIGAAQRSIYIENQYFTADKVGAALVQRLAEENGPEIVIVLRQLSHGWLEEVTMQTLRAHLIEKLRAADKYGHLRVFYPYIQGLAAGTCIDVHAKLLIVDDDYIRIGSANIANRSMGLDSECDVTIAASGKDGVREAIGKVRTRLLAEHLGLDSETLRDAVSLAGSLRSAIDRLQSTERTLKTVEAIPEISSAMLNLISVADPERPVNVDDLMKLFSANGKEPDVLPSRPVAAKRTPWLRLAAVAIITAGLTALWQFTPLAEFLKPQRIATWAQAFGGRWWAPLLVVLAYTPAAIVMFPRSLITLFGVVAFGPWPGFCYAMLGIESSAWLTYVVGSRLDRSAVRRLAGYKLNRIITVLQRRGLVAMIALRLVPLAPFWIEGVVAGAVRIKLWHYMLGTAIGMLPGTLAATVFGNQIQSFLANGGHINYWLIAAAASIVVAAAWIVRRWLSSAATPAPAAAASSR